MTPGTLINDLHFSKMQLATQSSDQTLSHQDTHHWLVNTETKTDVQKKSKRRPCWEGSGVGRDRHVPQDTGCKSRFWAQEGKK